MVYDFECSCGEVVTRTMPMSEVKSKVKCKCGKMAKRVWTKPNSICRYSYADRAQYRGGHPRAHRGRGF